MELRKYWLIIKRRWLIILIPTTIVLIVGILTYNPPPTSYNVGVRFIVGQNPTESADLEDEERYYNWLTSEYIVNGLTDWVRGGEFAILVSEHLAGLGYDIQPGAIQGGLAADNARSMLTISLTNGDQETLDLMINGVIAVLLEDNAQGLPQLGGEDAVITQLDQPLIHTASPGIRGQLEFPVRILLALVIGLGVALLVEYLDPTIRSREEIMNMDMLILGEIPKE